MISQHFQNTAHPSSQNGSLHLTQQYSWALIRILRQTNLVAACP